MDRDESGSANPTAARTLRGHTRDLLRGSAAAALAKVATTAVGFMFNLVLARQLGAEQTGIVLIAISVAAVASVLSRVGLDNAALKFASRHAAADEWSTVKAVYLQALRMTGVASVVLVALLSAGSGWLAESLFSKPELSQPLFFIGLSVLPLSLLNVHAQFLKSIRMIGTGLFLQNAAISGLCLVGMLLFPAALSANVVAELYLFASIAATVVIAALWLRRTRLLRVSTDPDYCSGEMSSSSAELFVVAVMNQIVLPWGALLLLGVWGTEAEAGQFGIVRRLAMLINFAYLAVESITGPKFAALFAAGDTRSVRHVAGRATLLMSLIAGPVAALFVAAPEWVMGWFGPDFVSGAPLLVILTVGQLINAVTGSVANLLIMSGHERSFRNLTLAAALANILLCVTLIPGFGALGAAWATALAVGGLNLAGLLVVRRKLGFFPLPGA